MVRESTNLRQEDGWMTHSSLLSTILEAVAKDSETNIYLCKESERLSSAKYTEESIVLGSRPTSYPINCHICLCYCDVESLPASHFAVFRSRFSGAWTTVRIYSDIYELTILDPMAWSIQLTRHIRGYRYGWWRNRAMKKQTHDTMRFKVWIQ